MSDTTCWLPETVAAVDLGSNSFHLLLARLTDGQLVTVDRLKEMVQLAAGLDQSQQLDAEARERALECLRRFGQRLRHVPTHGVRAVGTNTLRSAHNAGDFLAEAEEALGHSIETISGIEEARLIYLGVAHSLARSSGSRLVIDVGGGSTELIVGDGFQPRHMESLYLGCVTLSRRFFPDGKLTLERWKRAELAVRQELAPVEQRFRDLGWKQAVGSSGTVRTASQVLRAANPKAEITLDLLRQLRDEMLESGHVERLDFEGLTPRRRPYFPGGIVVLTVAVQRLRIKRLLVADGALREGVLYDLLGRIRDEDVRGRSVYALADRYHVDWAQASRVEAAAITFLDQVADDWNLAGPEPSRLLSWAAQLHEIGLDIAHRHYHKHGEYVLTNTDLAGFSLTEQRMLAVLMRAHRRKFPSRLLKEVPKRWSKTIERLGILLRLAVLLHRGRGPDALPELGLTAAKRSLEVRFPEGWLDDHPQTRADLEQEQAWLGDNGFGFSFESEIR